MSEYYYSNDGHTRLGPINSRQLKQLAQEGVLAPNSLVWKEGLAGWIPAERLKGLFPAEPPPLEEPAGYSMEPDPAVLAAAGVRAAEPKQWWYMREGQPTGPIALSALKSLLAGRIIGAETFVWTEGMAEWREARRVRELGGAPPVVRGPIAAPPSAAQNEALRWLIPVGRSPWAVVAGYCGLLGLFPLCGLAPAPVAIVTGIAAVFHLRARPDLVGMPRAITGIVLGLIGTVAWGLMVVAMMVDAS